MDGWMEVGKVKGIYVGEIGGLEERNDKQKERDWMCSQTEH